MLLRLYVHNFRCLENLDLSTRELRTALFIGKNGSGKSTIGLVLEIFQKIGCGINRVKELVSPADFSRGRSQVPMRFEADVLLAGKVFHYELALELPDGFKELRIFEEKLTVDGDEVYSREGAQVALFRSDSDARFLVDWHLIALPIIQKRSESDPLHIFKQWLSKILILSPIPALMNGESNGEAFLSAKDGSNFGEWFSGVVGQYPRAYEEMVKYLRNIMADFKFIDNIAVGKRSKSMTVTFGDEQASIAIPFKDLSDGEKCFVLGALVLAANRAYGPLLCYWDEPENYLAPSEVGAFVLDLRREFEEVGQFFMTSHNSEGILKFADFNTLHLERRSHVEPTVVRTLEELAAQGRLQGDLIEALIRGDI